MGVHVRQFGNSGLKPTRQRPGSLRDYISTANIITLMTFSTVHHYLYAHPCANETLVLFCILLAFLLCDIIVLSGQN